MSVRVYKDQMSLRPRARSVPVVVNPEDPSLGVVKVTLCEIPSGLFEELEGEAKELVDELQEINRNIASAKRRSYTLEDSITAGEWVGTEPKPFEVSLCRAELIQINDRLIELKAKRRVGREDKYRKQAELIAWGVCDHLAKDFEQEDGEPLTFEPTAGSYDGLSYRIAAPHIVQAYASVGQAFIDSLYLAVTNFQRGIVKDAKLVWEETKKAKDLLEITFKKVMDRQIKEAVAVATGKAVSEDDLADIGAEEEPDPNAERSTTTATTTA